MRKYKTPSAEYKSLIVPTVERALPPLLHQQNILNERVLPFFEEHMISVMRALIDRGTEYYGAPKKHYYELFLQLNEI